MKLLGPTWHLYPSKLKTEKYYFGFIYFKKRVKYPAALSMKHQVY